MPSSNGSAFFVVEGMCLDMEKLEVEPDTHFRRAVTDVPCNLGRPDVKRPSSGSDGPAKLDLQGADKHVSRKHVRIEWEPMSGLYQAVVLGKADIVVDGKTYSRGSGDMVDIAPLHSGSALRVGNVLCYFLLPREHMDVYPQSLLPNELKDRRALLASAAQAVREVKAADGADSSGGASPAAAAASSAAAAAASPAAASSGKPDAEAPDATSKGSGKQPSSSSSSSSSSAGLNQTGHNYRVLLRIACASMPRGRWSGRDMARHLHVLFPGPGMLPPTGKLHAVTTLHQRALPRADDDVSEEELAAALERGHARPRRTAFMDIKPEEAAEGLTAEIKAWLAGRMAELSLPVPKALGGPGAAVDPVFAAAEAVRASKAEPPAKAEATAAEPQPKRPRDDDPADAAATVVEPADATADATAEEPATKKARPAPVLDDDGQGVEI